MEKHAQFSKMYAKKISVFLNKSFIFKLSGTYFPEKKYYKIDLEHHFFLVM